MFSLLLPLQLTLEFNFFSLVSRSWQSLKPNRDGMGAASAAPAIVRDAAPVLHYGSEYPRRAAEIRHGNLIHHADWVPPAHGAWKVSVCVNVPLQAHKPLSDHLPLRKTFWTGPTTRAGSTLAVAIVALTHLTH
jgi:hypothetical protein